jgi:hypothetical protein
MELPKGPKKGIACTVRYTSIVSEAVNLHGHTAIIAPQALRQNYSTSKLSPESHKSIN